MRIPTSIALAAILLSMAAAAQQSNSFDGKWSGVMTTHVGDEAVVDLSIAASEGTWSMSMVGSKGAKNPCLRRDFPVVVTAQSADTLSIAINGASVLKGCITTSGVLTSPDGKTLEGVFKDGRKVKLNRK